MMLWFGIGMIVVGFLYALWNMVNGVNNHSGNFFQKHIAAMAVMFIGMVLVLIASGTYIYNLIERYSK